MTDRSASTRDRILFHLKTRGPQTVTELAKKVGLTAMGTRGHLQKLQEEGLVAFDELRGRRGRPPQVWRLTDRAADRFPDGYADFALEMLAGVRAAFGADGLVAVVEKRNRDQHVRYRERMPPTGGLTRAVAGLARIRTDEGYMAESSRGKDGAFMLVENHCPIRAAAETCQGICEAELELFRKVLGEDVTVERTEHLLQGDRRCVYRIRER